LAEISASLRQQVEERAQGLCEYCHIQKIVVVFMEVDHIIPTSAGGKSVLDNLCFSCPGCNAHKSDSQFAIDPETGEQVRLFNPRLDVWKSHFGWSEDSLTLQGKSSSARATIAKLQMNRPAILASRKVWAGSGWHPPMSD
jgi:hypothetical protein